MYILAISASAMINVFGEMLSVLAISLIVWDVTDASFAKDTAWSDFCWINIDNFINSCSLIIL